MFIILLLILVLIGIVDVVATIVDIFTKHKF